MFSLFDSEIVANALHDRNLIICQLINDIWGEELNNGKNYQIDIAPKEN